MTIESARSILSNTSAPLRAHPVVFDGLFGWFSPGFTRRGVVLCGTLGFEQLAAYRAWRVLAEDIAGAGCATLRFDYPGAGDSADIETVRLADLVGAISRAVGYLRAAGGVEEVVLVGLRFGGTLAALAARELAARGEGIDRLVLLAPFATGRAYLREMKLQTRNTIIWPGGTPLQSKPGTLNVHGFVLEQELIDDISRIAEQPHTITGMTDTLIINGTPSKALSHTGSGTRIRQQQFAKINHLISGEMNFKSVSDVIEGSRDINSAIVSFSAQDARAATTIPHPESADGRISGCGWTEEVTYFGPGLFGVICKPERAPTRNCYVLFVNSGTYVRSGPSRFTTRMARTLAARGVVSLRMDLKGMGESPDWSEDSSPFYNLAVLDDVKLAIDRLHAIGERPILLVGFCSGAYLAFHMACRDERVTDAALMNLYCFHWPSDIRFETVQGQPTLRGTTTYARSLLSKNTWRRLLTGRIPLTIILSKLIKAWTSTIRKRWQVLWRLPSANSTVVGRVAKVRERGGRLLFVYSADDPGLLNIQSELELPLAKIKDTLGSEIEIIDQCDHNFSTPESQDHILRLVDDLIDRRERSDRERNFRAAPASAFRPGREAGMTRATTEQASPPISSRSS